MEILDMNKQPIIVLNRPYRLVTYKISLVQSTAF